MPPPGSMALSSEKARAAQMMGMRPMRPVIHTAWLAWPATWVTENMAVPETTRPMAAP